MKKAFLLVLALTSVFSGSESFARSIRLPVYQAELTTFRLDEQATWLGYVNAGNVRVDLLNKELTLTLFRKSSCVPAANRMCPMNMPAPYIVTLPIVSTETDDCGSVIYVATKDLRGTDGSLQTLHVVDNTSNECKTLRALSPTEVIYETDGFDRRDGQELKTRSSFDGERLELAN